MKLRRFLRFFFCSSLCLATCYLDSIICRLLGSSDEWASLWHGVEEDIIPNEVIFLNGTDFAGPQGSSGHLLISSKPWIKHHYASWELHVRILWMPCVTALFVTLLFVWWSYQRRVAMEYRYIYQKESNMQRLTQALAVKEQGWRHQMEKLGGLLHAAIPLHGRHMAQILAQTRPHMGPMRAPEGALPDELVVAIERYPKQSWLQSIQKYTHIFQLPIDHENLLALLGFFLDVDRREMAVQEYMPYGSFFEINYRPSQMLDWFSMFQVRRAVAQDVAYLHSKDDIHLDLNPANDVFDTNMILKISDFGISRIPDKDVTGAVTYKLMGTMGYIAPEYMKDGIISKTSDVFSLGIVISRIITGTGSSVLDQYPSLSHYRDIWVERGISGKEEKPDTSVPAEYLMELRSKIRLAYTLARAVSCTLKNLSEAIGISMGSHIGSQPENSSGSDSMVSEDNGGINAAATWLVGSAEEHHMTGNRTLLSDFKTVEDDLYIRGRNGRRMLVSGRGSMITDTVVLHDVWFVQGMNENIVSVSQLIELDCSFAFKRDACYIWGADGKLIGKAPLGENGMFKLEFLEVPLVN